MANFIRDSNPFNNNRPRLTASERINELKINVMHVFISPKKVDFK